MTVTAKLQGGYGNCLFIMSTVLSYSIKHEIGFAIPSKIHNPHSDGQQVLYSPNIKYTDKEYQEFRGVVKIYDEPFFHYKEIPKFDCEVLVLRGYFQSEKFFSEHREQILQILGFDNIESKEDTCSIHYRSTDYRNIPNKHPVISKGYLKQAIGIMFDEGYKKFIVFSDDITAIRNILSETNGLLKNVEIEYSENKSEIEDLKLMASCSSNITANSSYSWWGAYINPNPNKIVIMPRRWFGKDMNHDTKDLYLPNAIVI